MLGSRLVAAVLVLAALALPAAPAQAGPCDARLCAATARADITPPVTTPMWGYSARAAYSEPDHFIAQHTRGVDTDLYQKTYFLRNEGIHTRLFARALVLRNAAGVEMALVQTDLGAMTGEMWTAVAKRVADLGISRDRLLVSATHTHGGPGAVQQPPAHGLLVGDNYDPRVVKRTVDGIVKAIADAHGRLAPSRVAIGQGDLVGASVNRSFTPHQGNPCPDHAAVEQHDCAHPGEDAGSHHAIDPAVTMIRADRLDGTPLGVWTSFAAHGTVFGPQMLFTGDNQGVAERLIERGIAARAGISPTQVVAAYANGTEGDVAPACSGYNDFSCNEQTGAFQAERVLALYDELAGRMQDDVALDGRLDAVYMNGEGGTSPLAILGAGPDCPTLPVEYTPGQGRKCPFLVLSGTGPNWFWIQTMKVGDHVLANIPGEMTVQMGRRVRKRIIDAGATHAVIVGLANDYMAYLTTPEEYDFQWYEGTFTLWGRNTGPLMADRIERLARAMLAGEPGPSFVEPPDTSGTQAANSSPLTRAVSVAHDHERLPGTALAQPAPVVRRGEVASFGWIGGQPSAEVTPDEAFVKTQRKVSGVWRTVFTDEGFEDILDYRREALEDRWATRWDIPLDAPAGRYRFVVDGSAYEDAAIVRYSATSEEFDVVASDWIEITGADALAGRVEVRARYLPADPAVNFRLRPAGPASGTVTVRINGATTASGGFDPSAGAYVVVVDVSAGDTVEVAPGALVDGFGNTNGGPWPPAEL